MIFSARTIHPEQNMFSRPVRRALLVATMAFGALSTAASAQTLRIITQGIETSTRTVSLPTRPSQALFVRTCATCAPLSLRVDENTEYFAADRQPVTLDQLRAACGVSDAFLLISYYHETKIVRRMSADCQIPSSTQAR
jgi:hypothetical protein